MVSAPTQSCASTAREPQAGPLCNKQPVLLHVNYAEVNEQVRQGDFQSGCWLTLYGNQAVRRGGYMSEHR